MTTNVWDGENRLVQVEHPDFTVTTYAYNADGLKVEKDDGVQITRFLYDGNNLLRELDDLGTVEAEFTYVPQPYAHLVSQQRDGDSSFYHFDGTRNTAALSDAAGVVTDEYEHDAWGKLRSSTGSTPNAHTYKGELLAYHGDPHAGPEESIYSLHHRDYVAQQGRLRSEDPAADDLNLYRYSGNDPINTRCECVAPWQARGQMTGRDVAPAASNAAQPTVRDSATALAHASGGRCRISRTIRQSRPSVS